MLFLHFALPLKENIGYANGGNCDVNVTHMRKLNQMRSVYEKS